MKQIIPFEGMSQYDEKIDEKKRGSACGPVTAAAIIRHHEQTDIGINPFYKLLGTTPIGLFTWRLLRNLNKWGAGRYRASKLRSIEEVKQELLEGRPVAMKFDRYFSFHWFFKAAYHYHWVPLIGFEEKSGDVLLYFHDNGKRNRPSKIRTVSYHEQKRVLSFIKIVPLERT